MPISREPDTYTAEEHVQWLRDHLPQMHICIMPNTDTYMATIWCYEDLRGDIIWRVEYILSHYFGAYLAGIPGQIPLSHGSTYQSFGFWNQALLHHAARVFPLPSHLQAGRSDYHEPVDGKTWERLERIYNISPEELPAFPWE